MTQDASALQAVAALSDQLRRDMYEFIRRSAEPVTRDQAAQSVGISRKLAAFHLDKLVAVGLLVAEYAQPGGLRRVGRAPKVYRPSDRQVQLSIPQREHGLLAEILLAAVREQRPDEGGVEAALRVAAERGRRLGRAERDRLKPGRLGVERALTCASQMLERHGFEPDRHGPALVRLANCPFHPMAAQDPDLVCGINHAFLAAFLEGLDAATVTATLAPRPGACCVELGAPASERDLP
ncbi:helix-turn-helix transcriptional regulator [Actinomadura namibiensis]|uniref:Putative ArsR family transcriptional regulator n=1 Tax=Actinomadura namibiensis TaxID=182080 RepID=A0A7W3LX54_ACTNM|nr:transcriptional regulator [Actinomadura namibiensis]MBA8955877.1 putative ArsR family transcriptional regulator [Actinomadura namibiensis]